MKNSFRLSAAAVSLIGTTALPVVVASAGSQEPRRLSEPDSIPVELASALISAGGFGAEPQILVGAMPEWIASKLFVPPGGRVLGSAFLGNVVVAVVTVQSAPDSILADVRRALMERGWTPPPIPIYGGGGFRPAPSTASASAYGRDILCNNDQVLTTSANRRRGVATDITMRVTVSPFSACRPPQPSGSVIRSSLPTLYNPAGANDARVNNECTQAPYSGTGTGTMLRTPMTAESLLDHYGKQLLDSGWTSIGERGTVAGRTWSRSDSSGTPLEVVLTITTGPQTGCREINMQLKTLRKP